MEKEDVSQFIKNIRSEIDTFLLGNAAIAAGVEDLQKGIYTNDIRYFAGCVGFHEDAAVIDLHFKLDKAIGQNETVVDVGCETGITGLLLATQGRNVTFFDYDNVGLRFINWYIEKEHINAQTVVYGNKLEKRDWALALDVIEHAGDSLGFLRWMELLGKKVVITYPLTIEWQEPFWQDRVDEWRDDEALRTIIHHRYDVFLDEKVDDRRFIGYTVTGKKWPDVPHKIEFSKD